MKPSFKSLAASLLFCAATHAAHAADMSECEVVLLQVVETETAAGEARVASYHSAEAFIASVRDDIPGHMTKINGQNIRGLMCRRNEVIPAHADYDIMATGIPFILSQDFDSSDTDSLTMYWKDGKIEHVYKGYPLSEEAQAILDTRLAGFSKRGLSDSARKAAEIAAQIAAQAKELDLSNQIKNEVGIDLESGDTIATNIKPKIETKE